jgi:hypothetical protein
MSYTPGMAVRSSATPTPEQDYKLLGVARDASPDVIKRRYRRLVRTCHPDRFFGNTQAQLDAEDLMQAINDAFGRVRDAPLGRRAPAVSATTAAPAPGSSVTEGGRTWRTQGGRLDPAVREALIESLRMPSIVDVLDEVLPRALGPGAAFLALFGLGRGLSQGDWGLFGVAVALGICAFALSRGDQAYLILRRGASRWWRR